MSELITYSEETFESIKHYTEDGEEFWFARELQFRILSLGPSEFPEKWLKCSLFREFLFTISSLWCLFGVHGGKHPL